MSIDIDKTLYLKSGALDFPEMHLDAVDPSEARFLRFTGEALEFDFYLPEEMFPPGTVLLTSSPQTPGGKLIARVQDQIFDNEDVAMWSHVALVDSLGLVWEANPDRHITSCSLPEFFRKNVAVHGRRLSERSVDAERLDAIIAEQRFARYPQLADIHVLRYFVNAMRRSGKSVDLNFAPNELICSSFIHRVLMLTCGFEPFPDVPLALPGHFAESGVFECLDFRSAAFRLARAA
jgi:hypothetical protein